MEIPFDGAGPRGLPGPIGPAKFSCVLRGEFEALEEKVRKFEALEEKVRKLEDMVDALWDAPGMPGANQLKEKWIKEQEEIDTI